MFIGICAAVLVAALIAPAGAQAGLRPVSDGKGLFTISIPSDWSAAGDRMSDTVFHGLRTSALGRNVVSTLAAHSGGEGGSAPGILAVAAVDLPRPVSPAAFGEVAKQELPPAWTVTQDGRATIAGRDAHYLYFIMHESDYSLYLVMAYFTVGRMGFLVVGGTLNEPDSIRTHFATISRILETFRPNPNLGASVTTAPASAAISVRERREFPPPRRSSPGVSAMLPAAQSWIEHVAQAVPE